MWMLDGVSGQGQTTTSPTPSRSVPNTTATSVTNEPNHSYNSATESGLAFLDAMRQDHAQWRSRNPDVELPLENEDQFTRDTRYPGSLYDALSEHPPTRPIATRAELDLAESVFNKSHAKSKKVYEMEIYWAGEWTFAEKRKVLDALEFLEERIPLAIDHINKVMDHIVTSKEHSHQCKVLMYIECLKILEVLESSLKVVQGEYKMTFHQRVLYAGARTLGPLYWEWGWLTTSSESEGRHTPGHVQLNTNSNNRLDWRKKPDNLLPKLIYHEISHEFGTQDNDSKGTVMNVWFTERWMGPTWSPLVSVSISEMAGIVGCTSQKPCLNK